MLPKKSFLTIFISFICFSLLWPIGHVRGEDHSSRVLLTYSSNEMEKASEIDQLQFILGHFSKNIIVKDERTVTKEDFASSTHVIYYGLVPKKLSHTFLELSNSFKGPFLAIGENNEQLKRVSFIQKGSTVEINKLSFTNNQKITYLPHAIEILKISAPLEGIEILMEGAFEDEYVWPLFLNKDNNFYLLTMSRIPFIELYFTECLHQFFDVSHPKMHYMYIIIENVDPSIDLKKLKEILAYLKGREIPFAISLSPSVTDTNTGKITHLRSKKEAVHFLQNIQKYNGTILFEDASNELNSEKFIQGIQELVSESVIPIGVRTGAYQALSISTQKNMKFNTVIGKGDTGVNEGLPPLTSAHHEVSIYPETVRLTSSDSVIPYQEMRERVENYSIIRDSVYGLVIPAYSKLEDVDEQIQLLEKVPNGVWLDFESWENAIRVPYVEISTNRDERTLVNKLPYYKNYVNTFSLSIMEIILWGIALLVAFSVLLFLIYTFVLRTQLRKRLFNERKINE